MKEILMSLLPIVAAEAIAIVFVLFKTYPVMQSKLEALIQDQSDSKKEFVELRKAVDVQNVTLARETQARESIKRDLDDTKQSMKEINLELRKAVEDNTKAIIALETTLKMLGNSLGNGPRP